MCKKFFFCRYQYFDQLLLNPVGWSWSWKFALSIHLATQYSYQYKSKPIAIQPGYYMRRDHWNTFKGAWLIGEFSFINVSKAVDHSIYLKVKSRWKKWQWNKNFISAEILLNVNQVIYKRLYIKLFSCFS